MGTPSITFSAATFLGLKTRSDLASWLGMTDRQLRYLLYVLPAEKRYTTFQIAKRNGGVRNIDAPHPALKNIQRKLLVAFDAIAKPSGIAKGYVHGASVVDHAWLHRRQRFVVLADIENFFPSITFPRVRGALLAPPFRLPPEVATCIAQLCCKDGVLPQGAPTSPAISNLLCRSLDHRLVELAKKNRCRVSRYADDICFSTSLSEIPAAIANQVDESYAAAPALINAVASAGFALNHKKFRVISQQNRQLVTGLVVNRGVSLTRRWRRQLRVLLHLVQEHGPDKAGSIVKEWGKPLGARRPFQSIEQVVRGKAYYAQFVDKKCGRRFSDSLYREYDGVRSLLPRPLSGVSLRLMAEGKTDLLHLESAHRFFVARGLYSNLRPRFLNFSGATGDKELMKTLERIAKSDIPELTVGVFDCDDEKFMKDHSLAPGMYRQVGANVFAMCLGAPSSSMSLFCVELLYARSQLTALTEDGRRIFLRDEFDPLTRLSADGLYKVKFLKKSLVVSDEVVRVADGYSSLLSKVDFAEMVHRGSVPFDSMDFEGFRPTFDCLTRLVDEVHGR